jgi:hypothetical protein
MNTYVVKDIKGVTLDTVTAATIDDAFNQVVGIYGPSVIIEKQFSASTTGLDPMWILLAVLAGLMIFGKGRPKRYL